jgi:hypothetical protein
MPARRKEETRGDSDENLGRRQRMGRR